jgi:hypothetical protein
MVRTPTASWRLRSSNFDVLGGQFHGSLAHSTTRAVAGCRGSWLDLSDLVRIDRYLNPHSGWAPMTGFDRGCVSPVRVIEASVEPLDLEALGFDAWRLRRRVGQAIIRACC